MVLSWISLLKRIEAWKYSTFIRRFFFLPPVGQGGVGKPWNQRGSIAWTHFFFVCFLLVTAGTSNQGLNRWFRSETKTKTPVRMSNEPSNEIRVRRPSSPDLPRKVNLIYFHPSPLIEKWHHNACSRKQTRRWWHATSMQVPAATERTARVTLNFASKNPVITR